MQPVVDVATSFAVELVVVVGGVLASVVLTKLKSRLDVLKKADELGIVDLVTDRVVELVEVEFTGVKGIEKRNIAVNKAIKILAEKNIHVSETEVIAGIENGVNKLKDRPKTSSGHLISSGTVSLQDAPIHKLSDNVKE